MSLLSRKKGSLKKKGGPYKKTVEDEPKKKKFMRNIEISSESEEDDTHDQPEAAIHSDEEIEESAQERKLRLAKKLLEQIEEEERERLEGQQVDEEHISSRLRDGILDQGGRLVRTGIADSYDWDTITDAETFIRFRNQHRLSPTVVAMSSEGDVMFSGGKDGRIIKWNIPQHKKEGIIPEIRKKDLVIIQKYKKLVSSERRKQIKLEQEKQDNEGEGDDENKDEEGDKVILPEEDEDTNQLINSGNSGIITGLAISSDGKFLASADSSNDIKVWDPVLLKHLHTFTGHRKPVTGLTFRRSTHTLYSCSSDRSVKVWNLDEMSYVESLFGHQDPITAIDAVVRERALTCGGRDSSMRLWKIVEESQLVFQGKGASIDCCKFLDEQHFLSGDDMGVVSLWGLQKKKPLYFVSHNKSNGGSDNWVTAIGALFNTDLFATGSNDGFVRLWKTTNEYRTIEPVAAIPITGFINWIEFSKEGDLLAIAVGQEHRLGRWWKNKEARNEVIVIPLPQKKTSS